MPILGVLSPHKNLNRFDGTGEDLGCAKLLAASGSTRQILRRQRTGSTSLIHNRSYPSPNVMQSPTVNIQEKSI